MPLFFGSSTVKPQHLSNRNGSGTLDLKDTRGTVVKLQNYTVAIEKKLAEGGFAIIYLVTDKSNRQFALKRQFINDDQRQLEACKRECCIVKCLQGHQNIVRYVDHLITRSKSGIYEYSLLTVYYRSSVLQLMNERLMSRRSLSSVEVLSIFCDMCEAVARLHHSQTPVIHRDLKASFSFCLQLTVPFASIVENILIDDRDRSLAPRYVLCDFGSATTKVLSLETHTRQFIEDEILRYTTLSYRAPEMIDIYAGRPIGTKSDIWAMGVLLYKLCYFTLPFGESALAIQNCSYIFPNEPECPEELRALIKILLQPDIDLRPDIYQVCCLAFEVAGKKCPVGNLNKVRRIPLSEALDMLRKDSTTYQTQSEVSKPDEKVTSGIINEKLCVGGISTSVNPRLRPKPSTSALRNAKTLNIAEIETASQPISIPGIVSEQSSHIARQNSVSSPDIGSALDADTNVYSSPMVDARLLGFRDLEEKIHMDDEESEGTDCWNMIKNSVIAGQPHYMQSNSRDAMSMHLSAPQLYPDNNRSNTFPVASAGKPGGYLRSSAFKPYSETSGKMRISPKESENPNINSSSEQFGQPNDDSFELVASTSKWNPFIGAPFDEVFINENEKSSDGKNEDSDKDFISLIKSDPFGAAPFEKISLEASSVNPESDQHVRITFSDDKETLGVDQAAAFNLDSTDVSVSNSAMNEYKYLNRDKSVGYVERDREQSKERPLKNHSESDWSSEDSSSGSSLAGHQEKSNVLLSSGGGGGAEATVSNANAFPLISASSSRAPLLSSSSFSLKSNTAPATSSTDAYNPYTVDFSGHSVLDEPIILHETNPFVNLDTTTRTAESFPTKTEHFSFPPSAASSADTFLNTAYSSYLPSDCTFDYNHQSGAHQSVGEPLKKHLETKVDQSATTAKKMSSYSSLSSLRCRLLSAGSSHSSDDSPQIDESGDKMLLKESRNKSHSHGISSKKKKLTHMEQYAASRASRSELSPYRDVGSSKHSPALKKHSKSHSGQLGFRRSGAGKLDASSFVNTSFQAEDWEGRPLSPKMHILPQIS